MNTISSEHSAPTGVESKWHKVHVVARLLRGGKDCLQLKFQEALSRETFQFVQVQFIKKIRNNEQAKMQSFAILFVSAPKDQMNEPQKKLI